MEAIDSNYLQIFLEIIKYSWPERIQNAINDVKWIQLCPC
ncbi:hypothetical protein GFS31_21090 [Leptolyngbya sp. BL0902]|nr:hypothetical protein GFS31_21090 [Leptolyngbya sp. BL0902]